MSRGRPRCARWALRALRVPLAILVLALPSVVRAAEPRPVDRAALAKGRTLSRSKSVDERAAGVAALAQSNAPEALPLLRILILRHFEEMAKRANALESADEAYEAALSILLRARFMNNAALYRAAEERLDAANRVWAVESSALERLFRVAVLAGGSFAGFDAPGTAGAMQTMLSVERHPYIRQWLTHGLAGNGDPGAREALLRLSADPDPMTRATAVRALRSAVLAREVYAAMLARTEDEAWQVRLAAYEAIARVPLEHAAPPLIAALERETGEIAQAINALLASQIGESFPEDLGRWATFWEQHGEAVLRGEHRPETRNNDRGGTLETFFNLPLVSTNVLFLVDHSGSMEDPLEHADPLNAQVRTRYELPATRFGVANAEVIRAVQNLPEGARFQIVVYADRASRFAERPTVATSQGKAAAIKWLLDRRTGWLTNAWDGLRSAFGESPEGGIQRQEFLDLPDTIVFLSDGTPTRGRIQTDLGLQTLVQVWNRSVGAVVLAVGVGDDHASSLLSGLAESTDGCYVDLGKREGAIRREREGLPPNQRVQSSTVYLAAALQSFAEGIEPEERAAAVRHAARIASWSVDVASFLVDRLNDMDEEVRTAAVAGLVGLDAARAAEVAPALVPPIEAAGRGDSVAARGALLVLAGMGPAGAPAAETLANLATCPQSPLAAPARDALRAMGRAANSVLPILAAAREQADGQRRKEIDAVIAALRKQ